MTSMEITDVSTQKALAEAMFKNSKLPEGILKDIFQSRMTELEETRKSKFSSSVKERIWSNMSTEGILKLRNSLLRQVSNAIERYDKIRFKISPSPNPESLPMFHEAWLIYRKSIINELVKEARTIVEDSFKAFPQEMSETQTDRKTQPDSRIQFTEDDLGVSMSGTPSTSIVGVTETHPTKDSHEDSELQ